MVSPDAPVAPKVTAGRSLRTLLGGAMVLGQVVVVLVLAVPVLQGRDSIIYNQAREMALARARLGANFLEHDLPRLSRPELTRHINAFLTSPDVLEARVVQGSKALASVWRPPGEPFVDTTATPDFRETMHGFVVTVPLRGIQPASHLEFAFSFDSLKARVAGVTTQVFVLVSLALLSGLLAAYMLSLTLIHRVERIVNVTTTIARGDLSPRLAEEGPAELATLSRSLNAMVDALARSQSELREANASLERRVEERTRQLVHAQEQLVEAERLITVGDMSAQLAHDVRNPLATLAVNVELMGDEVSGCACADRVVRHIEAIHRSLARTNLALGEYLEFAGLARVRLEPADLNETLRAEIDSLADWLSGKSVVTRLELAPGLPEVRLEPRRFRLAIRSLVRHAIDAMSDGGTLTVASSLSESGIEVRISDTGAPIREEVRRDLFKLFHGLRPNSTGPGLRLAREILRIHEGSLDLERTGDTGSTFLAVLPSLSDPRPTASG